MTGHNKHPCVHIMRRTKYGGARISLGIFYQSRSLVAMILVLMLLAILAKMSSQTATESIHVQIQQEQEQFYIYSGVRSTCETSTTDAQFKSNIPITWCQHQNSFASRQQFLSDFEFLTSPSTRRQFLCDTSTDLCSSYIAIRSHDVSVSEATKEYSGNNLVMALITGEIYLFNTNSKLSSVVAPPFDLFMTHEEDLATREREQRVKFESIDIGTLASIVQVTAKDKELLPSYYLETFNRLHFRYSRHRLFFDRGLRVVDMKLMGSPTDPIAVVLLTPHVQESTVQNATLSFISFASEIQQIANWNIVYDNNTSLNMRLFEHFGNLDPSGPMYFRPQKLKDTEYRKRQLISLYTTRSVSIYQIDLQAIQDMDIDLTEATQPNRLQSLFYQTQNEYEITALSVTVDPIRRPVKMTKRTNCSNVRYPTSLAIYLNIAEFHPSKGSRLTVHHVPEFSSFSFAKKKDLTQNPCDRPPTFNCRPGEYLSSECQICQKPVEKTIGLDSRVNQIQNAFSDVTLTESYLKNGQLNPMMLCKAFQQYPLSEQNSTVSECEQIVKNGEVNCEVDMFMTSALEPYLDSFFYLFWKEHIYLAQENNIISVISKSNLYDKVSFSLIEENKLQSVGIIRDLHVSHNDQHVFSSVYRNRWEIESYNRYIEVCQKLKENPDNTFLKPFSDYCGSLPPRSITSKDFALVSSSCGEGVYCPNFHSVLTKETRPGHFIYRSFIELDCPEGSYCPLGGRRLNCPLGFYCPRSGLSKPLPCPLPSAKSGRYDPLQRTCYQENLKEPIIAPVGTWAATTIFPPVLIPPGKFLLKVSNNTEDLKIAGIHDCMLGEYCNLGREIIANESDTRVYKDLLCPELTFCEDSKVIEPKACMIQGSKMPYCPAGTFLNSTCPAGYYCPSPKEKYPCATNQYCPEGSVVSLTCPSGNYCPSPDIKRICPKGHYCTSGSTYPRRCNFFLGKCPAGSAKNSLIASGVTITILLGCCIMFGYFAYLVYISCHRRRGDWIRRQKTEILTEVLFDKKVQIKQQSKGSLQPHQPVDTDVESMEIEQLKPLLLVKSEVVTQKVTIELQKPNYYMDLKFEELGLRLPSNNQIILHGVTGEIEHGKLTAVMGVSGAGKSTFISTLAGRAYYGKKMGKIFVNGKEVPNLDKYNDRIGFVPQDDIMIRECTVEESLYFSARTRLDRKKSKKEIMEIVDNVIHVLRLDHVRHSIIGDESTRGISGGERKRVSVGIELVAQPIVLFCDEPTSGLDSASSKEVCEALLSIARSGITVVSVIHQPRYECFEMFENLLLLGQGGRTVYMGEVSKVQSYFESLGYHFPAKVNPADYLMDITSGNVEPAAYMSIGNQQSIPIRTDNLPLLWQNFVQDGVKLAAHSLNYKINCDEEAVMNESYISDIKLPMYQSPKRSYISHFIMCFERALLQQIRHLGSICLDSFLVGLSAFFVGILFYNDVYKGPVPPEIYNQCPPELREGCKNPRSDPIFTLSNTIGMCIALCGVMGGLRVFGREKVVFRKESQTGLSTFFYFWAKDISMLPSIILSPAIFVAIFYSMVVPRAPAIYYFYSILLTFWSCFGLGYVISILFTPHIAQLAAVVMVFILNIFSGISPRLSAFADMYFPMRYMPSFSILRYSMELTYVNELWFYRKIYDIRRSLTGTGYHFYDAAYCCGMLVALGFGLRFLAYVMLLSSKPNSLFSKGYHRANVYISSVVNYVRETLYTFCAKAKQFILSLFWRQ